MTTTFDHLTALLESAERLLAARADQMLTSEEWDDFQHAVDACREPSGPERTETFSVDAAGFLVRNVIPANGEAYQHRCAFEAFEAIAYAIKEATSPFNLEDLRTAAEVPWSQAAVAFAFLRERSVVAPAGGRNHKAASTFAFEDAMIAYHALREGDRD